jgi:hypothetical protein
MKCKKCHRREATSEDELCDSCRFILIIDGLASEKTTEGSRAKQRYV